MKVSLKPLTLAVATLALATSGGTAASRATDVANPSQAQVLAAGAPLSPKARGNLTRQFVSKWGIYVQRIYRVPVGVWANRMVPSFVTADASNFRNALLRDTFEGAIAELGGIGHQLSDDDAISKLADSASGTKSIGELGNDLSYTPLPPCRIIDTRNMGLGAIAANTVRSFYAVAGSNFTIQGGSATSCGTFDVRATALAINLTAVTPAGNGYATVYPYGTPRPLASSVNYSTGAIVNNTVIVQIPNPLSIADFYIYSFAQSHYVADIVGYFAPPVATALQCVETVNTTIDVSSGGGTNTVLAPACATGYTETALNCKSSSVQMPAHLLDNGRCGARNNDVVTRSLFASRTCCRVPGR